MKNLSFFWLLASISFTVSICAQDGYPTPPKTETHLFYVQHSKNHNTYVYDANLKGKEIDEIEPLDIYRIVYTKGGVKKPLTHLQRNMAYGMKIKLLADRLFELHFMASDKLKFYLTLDKAKPRVYTFINKKRFWLNRIYVCLNNKGLGLKVEADYILFYGKNFNDNSDIVIKYLST